jgi:toxin YoeB
MNLSFAPKAWDSYLYWQKTDKATVKRINTLIKEIQRSPFEGIGKLEPLKHALSGFWSRRINDELHSSCPMFLVRIKELPAWNSSQPKDRFEHQ